MTDPLNGATTAVFAVTLSVALSEPVDVAWATKDGSGKAGVDYEAANGVVTFLPGETAKQIQVTVYGREEETGNDDRTFYIVLTPPTNAVLGNSLVECIIKVEDESGVPITTLVVAQGKRGFKGDPGLSAYEQAVLMGYTGTVQEWMDEIADASQAAGRAEDSATNAAASASMAEAAAAAAAFAGRIYATPAAGVDPVTGVPNGAYYNVRSTSDENFIDEYQNVNGVATPTGKSFPSSQFVKDVAEYVPLPYKAGTTYDMNHRVTLASGEIVHSTINGNVADPNTDMTGWVKDNSASQIFDGDKNQAQINAARTLNVEDFPSLSAAMDWVKANPNNYVYAKAGKTYDLNTGLNYLNRLICPNGEAKIRVPAGADLTYLNASDGSEVLALKNLTYLVAGKRGTRTTSTSYVYPSTGTVRTSKLENVKVYGLTDLNDPNSWSDDTNKTRLQGFISYVVTESSEIRHCRLYGGGMFATVDTANSNATHIEEDIKGFNVESLIYLPARTWKSGESKNCKIFNTPTQRDYWIKDQAASPLARNGKNCVMCEADHTDKYEVKDIRGVCVIEKSLYNTSTNSVTLNCSDDGSFSTATVKSPKGAGTPKSKVDVFNIVCKNPLNVTGVQDTYGWAEALLERIHIDNDVKNITKPFIFDDLGTLTYKNIRATNAGVPLYYACGNNVNKLIVDGADFIDCYDSNTATIYYKGAGASTIKELRLDRVKHYSANLAAVAVANLPSIGAQLDGVEGFFASKSKWFAKVSPFFKGTATNYLEVMDCDFTLKNSVLISGMWDNLKSTASYGPQANVFDFSIDFVTTNTTVPQPKVKAQFKRLVDTGTPVLCADFWSKIDISYNVTVANGVSLMTIGDKSFELTASFNEKLLKFYWDASTKTITQIVNFGGLFATTLTSDKINIYVNTADNRLIVNIGNGAWTGGVGALNIKVERF